MAGPEDERRDDDRAPITLRVDYRRLNTFFADYTKNISKGGTFIRTKRPLAVGTEFKFVLSLPGGSPPSPAATTELELAGIVKWVVADEDGTEESPAGMGIQFIFDADADRERVHALVSDLMRASLGPALATKLLGRP